MGVSMLKAASFAAVYLSPASVKHSETPSSQLTSPSVQGHTQASLLICRQYSTKPQTHPPCRHLCILYEILYERWSFYFSYRPATIYMPASVVLDTQLLSSDP